MTVSATTPKTFATGSGGILAIPVPFQFFAVGDLEVIERVISTGAETVKIFGSDYTVSGGAGGTGTVTSAGAVSALLEWHVRRATLRTQASDYPTGDPFPAETHEQGLDRALMRDQEIDEALGRSLHFPKTDPAVSSQLPNALARANKVAMFDGTGAAAVGDLSASIASTTLLVVSAVSPGHLNGRIWVDTATANTLIIKQSDGADWISVWSIDIPSNALNLFNHARLDGINTFAEAQIIRSTNPSSSEDVGLDLDRASPSPGNNDNLMSLRWLMRDSGGNTEIAAKLLATLLDPVNGSEDARLEIHTIVAGALALRGYVGQGFVFGNPIGGDPGPGQGNAEGLQINGTPVQTIIEANGAGKNLLINGNFDVAQRLGSSTMPAGSRTYCRYDRFYVFPSGASVGAFAGALWPDTKSNQTLSLVGGASVTIVRIGQRLPADRRLLTTLTFSAYVHNNSGGAFTPSLVLDTPTALNDFAVTNNRLTQALQSCPDGQWTRVTHSVNAGGFTDIGNGLQVELHLPSGSMLGGDVVTLAQWQLEPAGAFSGFERTDFAGELARCQRFYWKSFPYATSPGAPGGLAGAVRGIAGLAGAVASRFFVRWPLPMIKAPTLTLFNPSAANAQVRNVTDGADHTASAIAGDADQAVITSTGLAGTAIGEELAVHVTADAEL